jgi:hypothetical protein
MRIASVNVGQPRLNPWKTIKLTGIDKRPVEGPVMVSRPRAKGMGMVGLAGDRVYDVLNHGGPDQAVYAYAREDLDFWAAQLGRPGPPPYRLGRADEPERLGQEGVRGLPGVEPADPGVTAEPGFLAAGEPPGGLHRLQPGFVQGPLPVQVAE